MPAADLLALFVDPLERLGLVYMVTGSVASTLYGEPRLTNDVDVVIDLHPEDAGRFRAAYPAPDFYCPPEEEIVVEASRPARGHFNVLHLASAMKADLYIAGDDWLHGWALPRRRRIDVGQRSIPLAPPEYVVVRKLSYFREGGSPKHLRDVRALLAVRRDDLDRASLRVLAAREGVLEQWRQVAGEKAEGRVEGDPSGER